MHKVLRFIISGCTATAVNLITLFALVHFFAVWYLLASIISVIASTAISFTLQKFWTFRDHTTSGMHFQFMIYVGITAVNICINTALMYLFVSILGIWYLIAQVIASGLIAICNYFSYQQFVFKKDSSLF